MKTIESIDETLRIVRNVEQWQTERALREQRRRSRAARAQAQARAEMEAEMRSGRILNLGAVWPGGVA